MSSVVIQTDVALQHNAVDIALARRCIETIYESGALQSVRWDALDKWVCKSGEYFDAHVIPGIDQTVAHRMGEGSSPSAFIEFMSVQYFDSHRSTPTPNRYVEWHATFCKHYPSCRKLCGNSRRIVW